MDGARAVPPIDLFGDGHGGINRDGEPLGRSGREAIAVGGSSVDADHSAIKADEWTTGVSRLNRSIGLDQVDEFL